MGFGDNYLSVSFSSLFGITYTCVYNVGIIIELEVPKQEAGMHQFQFLYKYSMVFHGYLLYARHMYRLFVKALKYLHETDANYKIFQQIYNCVSAELSCNCLGSSHRYSWSPLEEEF